MIKNYSGNTKPFTAVLCAGDAKDKAAGLLEQLVKRGLNLCVEDGSRPCRKKVQRAFAVIVLLSEGFAKSNELQEALFAADSADRAIIPVHTDGAAQNDGVNRILFARNALFAENYSNDEELADRIFNGSVLEHPFLTDTQKRARRNSVIETAAGALVIAAAALIMIFTGGGKTPAGDTGFFAEQGVTADRYEEINGVLILGEKLYCSTFDDPIPIDRFSYANDGAENDGSESDVYYFYSHEDGSRIEYQTFENLDFLAQLPNLSELALVCVDTPAFPDLSACTQLHTVSVSNCTITDISALAGTAVEKIECARTPVETYAPLTGCEYLREVQIDLYQQNSSFSGFAPPELTRLWISNGNDMTQTIDLSALENCGKMTELGLERINLDNIDFTAGMPMLREIYLDNLFEITDITPLGNCPTLEVVHFQDLDNLTDVSVLGTLTNLREACLHCPITNLDFLKELPEREYFNLQFSRPMNDYSGLAAVKSYDYVHCNLDFNDYALVQDYLKDKEIASMTLFNINSVDLSQLPDVSRLEMTDCAIRDLTGFENLKTDYLMLTNMKLLRTLDGIEALENLERIEIKNCPRLTDFSALENVKLSGLELLGLTELPDFSTLDFAKQYTLTVGSCYGTDSLDFLNDLSDENAAKSCHNLDISEFDGLNDLSPLKRLKGWTLYVSPEIADFAKDVVENGSFREYQIKYPDGAWDIRDVEILSLEDLEILPAALLERAAEFNIAGNEINGRMWYERDENGPYFRDEAGHNLGYVGEGPLTDLTPLEPLTGLNSLNIYLQNNLTSLDGIQNLQQLETLCIRDCPKLQDISPAFTLGGLKTLELIADDITSIEGIENLYGLEYVRLYWNSNLHDLTPLLKLPNLKVVEINPEMEKAIASLEGTEYSFELSIS